MALCYIASLFFFLLCFYYCFLIRFAFIVKGFVNIDRKIFFQEAIGNCKGHSEKLQKSMLRLDVRKFLFSERVVNHWNALKQHAIDCNTVNGFKWCVDHYIKKTGNFYKLMFLFPFWSHLPCGYGTCWVELSLSVVCHYLFIYWHICYSLGPFYLKLLFVC